MRLRLAISIALGISVFPTTAAATEPARPRMQVNFPVDLTITGVGGAIWLTTEFLKGKIAPASCRWCDPPAGDLAVKNALRWDNTQNPNIASYVTGFALAPLAAFALDGAAVYASNGSFREWGEDATVIMQSIVVGANINQLVKFIVARERPFVNDLDPADKARTSSPGDNNLSFYSGHTMLGFVSAVSAGTVASLKGYRSAPLIWGTGLTLAAATGYLRIAADKHYLSDVLVGAVMGSATGFLVPWLHRPRNGTAQVTGMAAGPMPQGGTIISFQGILP
jgi:membrane-associated phospholipid phosphatase